MKMKIILSIIFILSIFTVNAQPPLQRRDSTYDGKSEIRYKIEYSLPDGLKIQSYHIFRCINPTVQRVYYMDDMVQTPTGATFYLNDERINYLRK